MRDIKSDPLYLEFARLSADGASGHNAEYNKALRRVMRTADNFFKDKRRDDYDIEMEIRSALQTIQSIQDALNPKPRREEPESVQKKYESRLNALWWHHNVDAAFDGGTASPEMDYIEQNELSYAIRDYLKIPWLHDPILEFMMVDALVYAEVNGLGESIKEKIFKQRVGGGLEAVTKYVKWDRSVRGIDKFAKSKESSLLVWKLLGYVAVPLALYFGIKVWLGKSIAWSLAIIYVACIAGAMTLLEVLPHFFPWRGKNEDVAILLPAFQEARGAYMVVGMHPWNPVYIKEILLIAARKGVIWKSGIFALIERAIARDPVLWEPLDD